VSIGGTLARARRDARLSIADVSSRTHIKPKVIDDIEHDKFSACGGDKRARGSIAAIAGALGVDSGPLIEAYDAVALSPAEWIYASRSSEPDLAADAPEASTPQHEAETAEAGEHTQPITKGQPPWPIITDEPVRPLTIGKSPYSITPGEPAVPGASGPALLALADRRPFIWLALGVALVAIAGFGGILLIVGASGQGNRHAAAADEHGSRSRGANHPTRGGPQRHSVGSHGQTRPPSDASSNSAQALVPASIAAFGPGGTDHGDSPQLAHQALAGNAKAPWHSAWYATPLFGNLQAGTGLLLDMGRPVTIVSARIALGDRPGTDLALRIGNSPTLASLAPIAHATGVGGTVLLKSAPTRGRYVLVWFTRLPPDQAGTFQVSVYDIKLRGSP